MTEYDNYFDKIFREMTKGMEDHSFRHFNSSMGIMIYSKEHYKWEKKTKYFNQVDIFVYIFSAYFGKVVYAVILICICFDNRYTGDGLSYCFGHC